ncbi:MAG TPA: rod-binding protein [Aliidongia sp.]|uniref:rod-binding protein n=1 Tax=Aliidongia sp. TaxID=1914230 RepID=UPI002DDD9D5E|nr:rod-binding protein [Aliidongia sp.]HEV2674066.1 rod-binding protein [Aliidongia sp.]
MNATDSILPPASTALGTYGRTGAIAGPGDKVSGAQMATIDKTAKEYEAGFVSAMLESMFAGIKTNKMFGGGSAEEMYRSLLNQEYGKAVAARGTLGIADAIKREMLHLQEAH